MAEEKKVKEEPKTEGKKSNNLIIIGLFAFLITVVVTATFLLIMLKRPAAASKLTPAGSAAYKRTGVHKEELGPMVAIQPEIIVNIASESGVEHYLKINITLELRPIPGQKSSDEGKGGPAVEEITKRVPQIRDTVISILRAKTKEKIDQKEGKDLIRSEIISSINKYFIAGQIKNVYFRDFVIQ
jgi:flagellar FliL protein